jgi:hypothetical protein
MNNDKLWAIESEQQELDSLEKEWFYHDPIFNLCIQLSYLNSSKNESYGAVAIQDIGNTPTIIGIGWNIYMGGKSKLKRQGYANHAEFQSVALAEALGYNLNDRNLQTTIHVAGRLGQEDLIFLNPESVPFTCSVCTTTIPKYFPNVHLATPSYERGKWRHMSILEAYYGSLSFKKSNRDRVDTLKVLAKAQDLNTDFSQEHIDKLLKHTKRNGFSIDQRIEWGILRKYEEILNLKSSERRDIIEKLVGEEYRIYRKGTQASLIFN